MVVAPGERAVAGERLDSSQGFAFDVEVNGGALIGVLGLAWPQPLADSRQVYPGFQESHCGAVAEAVGMQSLAGEARGTSVLAWSKYFLNR